MSHQGIQPAGDFQTQCGGLRMLHPRAPHHDRRAMLAGECGQHVGQLREIAGDQINRFT